MIKPLITMLMFKPEKCYHAFEMFRFNSLLFCQTQAILSREGEAKEVDFHVNSRSDCTPFQGPHKKVQSYPEKECNLTDY